MKYTQLHVPARGTQALDICLDDNDLWITQGRREIRIQRDDIDLFKRLIALIGTEDEDT